MLKLSTEFLVFYAKKLFSVICVIRQSTDRTGPFRKILKIQIDKTTLKVKNFAKTTKISSIQGWTLPGRTDCWPSFVQLSILDFCTVGQQDRVAWKFLGVKKSKSKIIPLHVIFKREKVLSMFVKARVRERALGPFFL